MNFPKHEYSKYIDGNLSFDNKVNYSSNKAGMVDRLYNLNCDGDIMLEPRLVEYLRKKKYYKKHNIKPSVKPEQEFLITKPDLLKIKQFLSGDRTMYLPENNDLNKEICQKPQFPCKDFMDDKRVPKLKKGSKHTQVPNMGMFVPDQHEGYYEASSVSQNTNEILDARDFTGSTSFSDVKFDPRNDSKINWNSQHSSQVSDYYRVAEMCDVPGQSGNRSYSNEAYQKNNGLISHRSIYGPKRESSNIGRGSGPRTFEQQKDTYMVDQSPMFSQMSNMDTNLKVVIPSVSSRGGNQLDTSMYMETSNNRNDLLGDDIDLETDMIRGMPTRTQKSYGFRNPEEHYYDFIDPAFQNSDNSVMEFPRGGEHTRGNNKKTARSIYARAIM